VNGLAVVVALAAAALFALGTSLQHHTASDTPGHVRGGFRLMAHLLRRPRWLLGTAVSVAAFLLHATALKLGTLTVVQPALVSGLVFTLPLRALMDHRRPTRPEVVGALVTACGLGLFLVVARPAAGQGRSDQLMAGIILAVGVVVGFVCARLAARAGRTRASGLLLGFAAGELSGLAAGVLKLTTDEVVQGPLALLLSWPPYALLFLALWGLTLNQRAYHSAPLTVSLPVFNVIDPVAGMAFGILVFGERPAHRPVDVVLETIGLLVMAGGAVALARHTPVDAPPPV
jgi:drug/metabolite transporter (DMT)-like permease